MFHTKCCRKIVHTAVRHLSSHISDSAFVSYCSFTKPKLLRTILPSVVQRRGIINEPNNEAEEILLPPLFDEPKIIYPSFFKSLKNQITISFLLPRLDKDFTMSEFMEGSKQALVVVSRAFAYEDYDSIKGLVTDETIETVRSKISMLNQEQKQLIAVKDEDITLEFPYEVGIMFNNNKVHERFAEITVVFHSYRDSRSLPSDEIPLLMGMLPEHRKNIYITNLRFIREFTEGVESSWTVNMINHFMLLSII